MIDGFRINSVEIEGFKGFTTPQEVDVRSRHVFLLGRNGNGKSSVIESIRWGLFGSTNRPNEVIANSGYLGECRVVITLMRGGEELTLRRRLIQGVSGGSDATLTDELGKEKRIRDVIPQLDSINAGEGMHIIFSSQSAPMRRQPADISPFDRPILNYVGLLHPRALLSQIDDFLTRQEDVEYDVSNRLTSTRQNLDERISTRELRRRNILRSAPWGNEPVPTVGQSENKARDLIQEITSKSIDGALTSASLAALIEHASISLQKRREQTQSELQKESANLANRIQKVDVFRSNLISADAQKANLDSIASALNSELKGISIDELRGKVDETRANLDTARLKRRIIEDSISLLNRVDSNSTLCPVCDTEHARHALQSLLRQNSGELSEDATSNLLNILSARLKQAGTLKDSLEKQAAKLARLGETVDKTYKSIYMEDKEELTEPITRNQIDTALERLVSRKAEIESQITNNDAWLNKFDARLSKLREEDDYHQTQRDLHNLGVSKTNLSVIVNAYNDLVAFGASVRKIKQVAESCYNEQLKKEIPNLSENLTKVFSALTQHPYYDRLIISDDLLPKLELRVASTQDPLGLEDQIGVLNGQAESALRLVPYIVFSQADDTPTEVYLVMLDDPTQASDEEHTEILVKNLADIGHRVQIMVASHETDRFRRFLPKYFEPESYVIIEPTNLSRQGGPTLNIDYQ